MDAHSGIKRRRGDRMPIPKPTTRTDSKKGIIQPNAGASIFMRGNGARRI